MHFPCSVLSCTPLTASIYKVILRPINKPQPLAFSAGQHIYLQLLTGESCAFSIASSPRDTSTIELHILNDPEQETSRQVFELLKRNIVNVEPPQGDCFLPEQLTLEPASPLILIAAGTGFAQMQSILHEVFAREIKNPVYLYRGARKTVNLYPSELIEYWLNAHDNFHYIPIISEIDEDCHWRGREGLLHDAVCEDFDHFNGARVFISGSPAMVYATLDVLVAHGINEDQVESDTFSYAPR